MHPDEGVQLAINDLRSRAPSSAAPVPAAPADSVAVSVLRAYLGPLRWYVTDGRTPVADAGAAVGHLPRPRFAVESVETSMDAALLALGVDG